MQDRLHADVRAGDPTAWVADVHDAGFLDDGI